MSIGGKLISIAFLILVAFLSLVDTVSTVVYVPYMQRFKEQYMSPYMTGECMGGLLCGIVALLQGAGSFDCISVSKEVYNDTIGGNVSYISVEVRHNPPRFSVAVFFVFLSLMLAISLVCFFCTKSCTIC